MQAAIVHTVVMCQCVTSATTRVAAACARSPVVVQHVEGVGDAGDVHHAQAHVVTLAQLTDVLIQDKL